MANGFHGLKGYEYQATVSLDILLERFHRSDAHVEIRPEGEDDLVVRSLENGSLRFFQIKKPRENADGELTGTAWTLSDVARELLPRTLARLTGNRFHQLWVLGDSVNPAVDSLIAAGDAAPAREGAAYVDILHIIARDKSNVLSSVGADKKRPLSLWRPSVSGGHTPADLLAGVSAEFKAKVNATAPGIDFAKYETDLASTHAVLPHVLQRIGLRTTYGTEHEVRGRVQDDLVRHYRLPEDVVKYGLVRNLRGYIQDIAGQKDTWIDKADFELELRSVWPQMSLVVDPPAAAPTDIERESLVELVMTSATQGALEVRGVSGSGKTRLASSVCRGFAGTEPEACTFYSAVRTQHQLRDALAGVAFHLRRRGAASLFRAAVDWRSGDEKALLEVAAQFNELEGAVTLLIDLADGTCSDTFARELALFVEHVDPQRVRLIVFGQECALRMLTAVQRNALAIPAGIDLPGFDLDEFCLLVSQHHAESFERSALWRVYESLTAGRSAGLHARLADTIAQCTSLAEMQELVKLSPESALAEADRMRYQAIPGHLRSAADVIVCCVLPFDRSELETLFPDHRIREAIIELIHRGLLRQHDADRLEMHETVRAGLESLVPPATKKDVHSRLASHYLDRGQIIVAILHMERSGAVGDAHETARAAFLAGMHLPQLVEYLVRNHLVNATEVVDRFASDRAPEQAYLLPRLLSGVGDSETADRLLQIAETQADRFDRDFNWSWRLAEAVLVCAPEKIYELAQFAITPASQSSDRLACVALAASRTPVTIDDRFQAWFDKQHSFAKAALVRLLPLDSQRAVLSRAIAFINDYEPEGKQKGAIRDVRFRVANAADAAEFLASIPVVEPVEMLVARSPLLGRIEGWIWTYREILAPHCCSLIEAGTEEETVLENALRVLMFYGDRRAVHLAQVLGARDGRLRTIASLAPVMMPFDCDPAKYHSRLCDVDRDISSRIGDFAILTHITPDLDSLYSDLMSADSQHVSLWEFLFVMQAVYRPFRLAIPPLEKLLSACADAREAEVLAPVVVKLSELPGVDVTEFLLRMLDSPWECVRTMACLGLENRRSKRALEPLLDLCRTDPDPAVVQMAVVAAMACGPTDLREFDDIWERVPTRDLWRCVLAGRLRAVSASDLLVKIANSPVGHWELRRAAINAAGSLPFDAALEKIAPIVMAERSPFEIDRSPHLMAHLHLAWLLLKETRSVLARFAIGEDRFAELFGEVLDAWFCDPCADGAPSGADAARWLHRRLAFHGWPGSRDGPDAILRELHIPILHAAVLRGLRRLGRRDLIERIIGDADSEWLVIRGICEWAKDKEATAEDVARLRGAVAKSNFGASPYVGKCMRRFDRRTKREEMGTASSPPKERSHVTLRFEDACQALREGHLSDSDHPIVLDVSEKKLIDLVGMLGKKRVAQGKWQAAEPRPAFTQDGFTVRGARVVDGGKKDIGEALRPAVAAANRFGLRISWHEASLVGGGVMGEDHRRNKYVETYLRSLVANGNARMLYQDCEAHPDLLLSDELAAKEGRYLIDARAVPHLRRIASSGTDAMMEDICRVASFIPEPAVDPLLCELFARWVRRFRRGTDEIQHARNHFLWQSFSYLRKHPRFEQIPDWDLRLLDLLQVRLAWYHKTDVVEVVAKSPRAYGRLEAMLLHAAPFEHFNRDEVDRLDDAAEALFNQFLQDAVGQT